MADASVRFQAALTNPKEFRALLTSRLSETDLQGLCFDLGMSYENLGGKDHVSKVLSLLTQCVQTQRLSDLVALLWEQRSDLRQDIKRMVETTSGRQGLPVIKYFAATGVPRDKIPETFGITSDRFVMVDNPGDADRIIFDLSNPPPDWLKYVYLEGPLPEFERIIFVQLGDPAKLEGRSPLDILVGSYQSQTVKPPFEFYGSQDSFSKRLEEIENNAMWKYTKREPGYSNKAYAAALVGGMQ